MASSQPNADLTTFCRFCKRFSIKVKRSNPSKSKSYKTNVNHSVQSTSSYL